MIQAHPRPCTAPLPRLQDAELRIPQENRRAVRIGARPPWLADIPDDFLPDIDWPGWLAPELGTADEEPER